MKRNVNRINTNILVIHMPDTIRNNYTHSYRNILNPYTKDRKYILPVLYSCVSNFSTISNNIKSVYVLALKASDSFHAIILVKIVWWNE